MFEFDEGKAAKRLMEDYPYYPYDEALRLVKPKQDNLHEKLQPAFIAWLNGEMPEFEYEGLTLDYLKNLIRTKSYFDAIVQMNIVLKDPKYQVPRHRERRNFSIM